MFSFQWDIRFLAIVEDIHFLSQIQYIIFSPVDRTFLVLPFNIAIHFIHKHRLHSIGTADLFPWLSKPKVSKLLEIFNFCIRVSVDNDTINSSEGHSNCKLPYFGKNMKKISCENFTRWLGCEQGVRRLKWAQVHVLASPTASECKKIKQIGLQQVGVECPHHCWVSPPLNLHS